MIGRPPPCRRSAVALQIGRRAALTAPTLDGADVALQAREKHLHRGLTPIVFRPSTAASSPRCPTLDCAAKREREAFSRLAFSINNKWLRPAAGLSRL